MVVVNLTDAQYQQITQQHNGIMDIVVNPWFLSIMMCVIVVALFLHFRGKNKGTDPSTKPWWGLEVRGGLMQKEVAKRVNDLGLKCDLHVEKGTAKLGNALRIEYDNVQMEKIEIDPKTKERKTTYGERYRVDRILYRKYGFIAWLMSLFGYGFKSITITPDAYKLYWDKKKRIMAIDPTVHLINDSGVWTMSTFKSVNANDEILIRKDFENIHGNSMDFLRKLAVNQASVAAAMEKASHDSEIKQQERKSRTSQWVGSN